MNAKPWRSTPRVCSSKRRWSAAEPAHPFSELKNELRLAQTTVQGTSKNPLKFAVDPSEALRILLQPSKPGHLPADQAVSRAFRDLQAHQVALLAASRAAVRGTLEHFSPEQLILRFERDNKPLIATSGSRWRAYRPLSPGPAPGQ